MTKLIGTVDSVSAKQPKADYPNSGRRCLSVLALVGVLTAALWLFDAPAAEACSCEGISNASIDRGDAGLVGTISEMNNIPPEWEDQRRFLAKVQVQTDLKDNLADVVYLTSEVDDGGNCGVSWRPGIQIAAVVYEEGGVLRTDGCSTMSPEMARAWRPATTVGGQATLLIGGDQPYRMVAYDQAGVPIAFAFGSGNVRAASLCPGADVMLELVNYPNAVSTIDARSLATFEIMSSVPTERDGSPLLAWDLRCDAADGTSATTSEYILSDGVFSSPSATLPEPTFDPQTFWPRLETESTAPVTGESWMSTALELDEPVEIEATGVTAPVRQLGSGFAFGLGQEIDGDGVPLTRDDPTTDEGVSSNSVYWAGGIGMVIGISFAVIRAKRKQRK